MDTAIDALPSEVLQVHVLARLPFLQRAQAVYAVCHQWQDAGYGLWGDVEAALGADPTSAQLATWLTKHLHEVHDLVLHCTNPSTTGKSHPLALLLPLLPSRLQRVELTVPSDVPARDVALALSHCPSLATVTLHLHSIAAPRDLDPLASPTLTTCTLRVAQPCTMPCFFPFVQHCPALESLDVAVDNSTACTTALLSALPRLQRLSLRGVNLDTVPDMLTQLTALSDLDISFNNPPLPPEAFPRTLAGLKALRRVVLHDALAHYVPTALSTLPALQTLDVAYNTNAQAPAAQSSSLDESPRQLRRTHLHLPATMSKTLQDLCLSSNALVPAQLSVLLRATTTSLRQLDLSGCGLAALPAALTALTALEHLDLSGNDLPCLPVEALLALPSLRTLHCKGNAAMRLTPDTLSLACHPTLALLDLRRDDCTWDAASLLVLVHTTWLVLARGGARCVWVGCEDGVVVCDGVGDGRQEVVYRGEFGGGAMERAVEARVRARDPDFHGEVHAMRRRCVERLTIME